MKNYTYDYQLFGAGENVLGTEGNINANNGQTNAYPDGSGLAPEMRTYYADYLIDNAEPELFDTFVIKKSTAK